MVLAVYLQVLRGQFIVELLVRNSWLPFSNGHLQATCESTLIEMLTIHLQSSSGYLHVVLEVWLMLIDVIKRLDVDAYDKV